MVFRFPQIGPERRAANNHELESPQQKKDMDLYNNDLGIKTYKSISGALAALPAYNPGPKLGLIANTVLQKITNRMEVRLTPENVPLVPLKCLCRLMDLIFVINQLFEKQVNCWPAFPKASTAFILMCFVLQLIAGCRREGDGVFEITDPSRPYVFYDSAFHDAFCCVDATVTGKIDGTAKVQIQYEPQSQDWVGGFDL